MEKENYMMIFIISIIQGNLKMGKNKVMEKNIKIMN